MTIALAGSLLVTVKPCRWSRGDEDKTARRRRPAIIVAKSRELAVEQVEHLVLARVHMRVDRQSRRIGGLHHTKLAQRVLT